MDFAVDTFIENLHFKQAVTGEILGTKLRLRKNALVMCNLDGGAVHDVTNRVDGDQLDVPNALGKNDRGLLGRRSLAVPKVPEVLIGVLGVVGEFDP